MLATELSLRSFCISVKGMNIGVPDVHNESITETISDSCVGMPWHNPPSFEDDTAATKKVTNESSLSPWESLSTSTLDKTIENALQPSSTPQDQSQKSPQNCTGPAKKISSNSVIIASFAVISISVASLAFLIRLLKRLFYMVSTCKFSLNPEPRRTSQLSLSRGTSLCVFYRV